MESADNLPFYEDDSGTDGDIDLGHYACDQPLHRHVCGVCTSTSAYGGPLLTTSARLSFGRLHLPRENRKAADLLCFEVVISGTTWKEEIMTVSRLICHLFTCRSNVVKKSKIQRSLSISRAATHLVI